MEEKKFVCKFCSRKFACGKSLGGHIRTHMMNEHNSVKANEEKRINANSNFNVSVNVNGNGNAMFKFDDGRKRKRDFGSSSGGVGGDDVIYGLRENPKKTTRFVHSNVAATIQMEKFCKECGKGFPSLKALCGHMACHSEKDKGINRIVESSSEKQKLVMDSQSDTETSVQTRRSKRMKFKNVGSGGGSNNNHQPSSSSLHWGNCSSSVSEVEQEQEDVALCLMMLSRDSTYKGRFALVTESSDNNSVVLEAKSPSVDTKFAVNRGKNKAFEVVEKKLNKDVKLKSVGIGYVSDNSNSEDFNYGPKKVDSDESSDDFFMNEKKSKKVGFGEHEYESSKKIMSRERSKNSNEFKKLVLDDSVGKILVGSSSMKNGYSNDEMYDENGGKELKIERESFSSSDDSAYESDENSTDSDSYQAPKTQTNKNLIGKKTKYTSKKGKKKMKSKKSKEHECPICNKIFKSGQALGGHKRSHFVGGSDDTLVIRPSGGGGGSGGGRARAPPVAQAPPVPCFIDLNLPAPVDE
ncbi:uncharacterized protein [Cicer arietinum]|uniref:Uncharacterized protein LOC101498129 n=1 Tax=Cicer arietinum TaxID=3827 RepID=A0A1S2XJ66_CICAR|nr:uncharacterized protein LOC101498129 [Cicer arietinum]